MMRVMVLGGAGMLGSALVSTLQANPEVTVISVGRKNCEYNIDCLDFNELAHVIDTIEPDVIINSIAIVDLNQCENDQSLAIMTHVELPKFLSVYKNIYHVYISTDSVYSGDKKCWSETDPVTPVNYYAKTKFMGEKPILDNNGVVIRTNIYGKKGNCLGSSLFEWAYKSIQAGDNIHGYDNVYFNPLSVSQLSKLIMKLLFLPTRPEGEILNAGSDTMLSKYDFINIILASCNPRGISVKKSELRDNGIIRPKNTTLDVQKMYQLTSCKFDIHDGINELVEGLKK